MMINISWIRWHIYNFVVCKYKDNKQSESESDESQNGSSENTINL